MSAILPDRWLRLMPLSAERELRLVRGEGAYVWDDDDRCYLDLAANHGSALLGHGHPAVLAAIERQLRSMSAAHHSFGNDAREELVEALSLITPEPLADVLLVNSGSEAVEAALTAARLATGRRRVLAMAGAHHGSTAGARSVSDGAGRGRRPSRDVSRVPYGDLDAAEAALDASVAAVIVEPIQGDAGVRVPPPGYLAGLAQRTRRCGALLIVDEGQTALRTGSALACTRQRVVPDLLCLARGLAGGLPIGVVAMRGEVARALRPGWCESTDAGNPVVCAAAAATVRIASDPTLQAQVATVGDHLLDRLRGLRLPGIREARGEGLMLALELRHSAAPVVRELQVRGVLVIAGGGGVIRFLPPLVIDRRQADQAVEALAWSIRAGRGRRRESSVTLRGVARRPARVVS